MPTVSIVIPCYNEQATICLLLDALYQQTYPRSEMEVIIADGLSTDGTCQVIKAFQLVHADLDVRVVENARRSIPAALNQGIAVARGTYIVRLDAHSMPQSDYVEHCVVSLEDNKGENVGGVWQICPGGEGIIARSIAAAAAHPFGVGDAHYRYTDTAAIVDTVPFGAFRRDLVTRIGGFDETLLTNEDYEFNVRVRQAGGVVWLDPAIRSTYFARASLGALAHQYWRYGYWKARMLRRYPHTLRWRQAIPPMFALGLIGLALFGICFPLARWSLIALLSVYFFVLMMVGLQIAFARRDLTFVLAVPPAIGLMHFCWGAAFLWSGVKTFFEKNLRS